MKFYIENDGDSSVEINGFSLEIDVDDRHDILDDMKEDFESFMKEKMLEYFNNFDGKTRIYTDKELSYWIEQEENLNEGN